MKAGDWLIVFQSYLLVTAASAAGAVVLLFTAFGDNDADEE